MYKYISPDTDETYQSYIAKILQRDNIKDEEEYQERHHILPKCLGGTNDDFNLVYLYAEEHYYAHKLLAIDYPDQKGLQTAWWMMCHCSGSAFKRRYIVSSEDYAEARKRHQKNISGKNNCNYGGVPEAAKKKMSENHADVNGGKNPRAKKVQCVETGEIFDCAADAGRKYNLTKSNPGSDIRRSCRGEMAAGYDNEIQKKLHWIFI